MATSVTPDDNLEQEIWTRLIGPKEPTLSPKVAEAILDLEFPREDKARIHELSQKAKAGKLTPKEEQEIDSYGRVGSTLGILKSKARVSLKKAKENGRRS